MNFDALAKYLAAVFVTCEIQYQQILHNIDMVEFNKTMREYFED